MFCCAPLSFNPPFSHKQIVPYPNLCRFPISISSFNSFPKSHACFANSSSYNSDYEREEARWLREEERWLREEQRWLRQESRWNAERESLLCEISALKIRIEELERLNSIQGARVSEKVAKIVSLLQTEADLGKVNRIAEGGSSAVPLVVEAADRGEVAEELVVKEVVRDLEREGRKEKEVNKRSTLRKGSEGDDVREMQEALQILGFYTGEEDMEYSYFSSGTERAVKAWQEDANGAAVASIAEISETQQTVIEGVTDVEATQKRVFLLGENRWEEPSRLVSSNKQIEGVKNKDTTTVCHSCHGEGRLLCTECDGTGEPNIEPQFLEWIDEGTKCPYCEGLGYMICDVCEGKAVV